ncbi:MAG: hypothetical protein DMF23_10730 [Verrucomicrobia bacterium]|nr:MAG: hypothetical protein DMF23_10730 [Verrucomicrobiota bacterium]
MQGDVSGVRRGERRSYKKGAWHKHLYSPPSLDLRRGSGVLVTAEFEMLFVRAAARLLAGRQNAARMIKGEVGPE